MSYIVDRRNLDFLMFDMFDVERVLAAGPFEGQDRELISQLLDTAQRIAEAEYLPSAATLDASPPTFVNGEAVMPDDVGRALRAYIEAGLSAQSFPPENGGLGLSHTVSMTANGMFIAANVAIANYFLLTAAAARLLLAFGTDEQKARYASQMIAGRWMGTMCLSEPQAGSSLADITTRAEPAADGAYHLRGTKIWISGGGHRMSENIVHLVLARLPDAPAGVKGISLFLVPQKRLDDMGAPGEDNNVRLIGLAHKMGQRGTTNCQLNFGEDGPSVGHLIGKPNQGLHAMFHMMNEARIGVGHVATMSGLMGYLYSRDYAVERLQGRRIGQKDPASPQIPLIEHVDVRRMLLAQKAAVEGALALCTFCALLVDQQKGAADEDQADLALLIDVLTPIVKSWPSEHCLEANKWAMQILGGAGYTSDHPIERLYRDNRLNHIYEGTFGIQGIDLLGRKVRMADGRGLDLLLARIKATIDEAAGIPALSGHAGKLEEALGWVRDATAAAVRESDPERSLANATLYLDATGTVVIAWLWLWQAMVAARAEETAIGAGRAFYQAKHATCDYFFRYMLPRAQIDLRLVEMLDDSCLVTTPEQIRAA
ncbi:MULTISPECIES: acyl-CoA dehydrogenase [Sphingobium]|uniref:3-methylmercaptopropionyl-CoA dehydrogenase n=1 Tax=Sphingobium chungbukense TaxID=56193 RepID=A0A0M3ANW8_9SPHN|nr:MULTISPECIES: acyl-CoA dehydrogenase [Sphingobium]KKW91540.1 acyl-CoA dehydrogenase [Sphingobium chungbukense]PJG46439.1 acyl-CoA dehydrogenase [Sphingobium sp. LB126]